jgi:hypothetical protein
MKQSMVTILFGVSFLVLTSCSGQEQPMVNKADPPVQENGLRQGYVCMVDNSLKDSLLIPIVVDDITYYGCCAPCIELLESDTTYHYATDPVSGKIISKATAVMALRPGSEWEVEYFESVSTLKQHQLKTTK